MIKAADYLKEAIEASFNELVASKEKKIKLPSDDIFISFEKDHEGFLCFEYLVIQDKKVYILHKK